MPMAVSRSFKAALSSATAGGILGDRGGGGEDRLRQFMATPSLVTPLSLPLPAPPPAASPIQAPEAATAAAVMRARGRNRAQAALARGRKSNILTSGLGLTTPASTAPKTVLGA